MRRWKDSESCDTLIFLPGWPAVGRGRVEVDRRWTNKAESPGSRGTVLIVFFLEGDQWQNSAWYGAYSDKFSPPIPGWVVKSEIWHRYCSHDGCCCSHKGRKWLVVTLNALTFVSELVDKVGRVAQLDPESCESEIFRWSRRLVERASYESERGRGAPSIVPRTSQNVVEVSHSYFGSSRFLWAAVLFFLIVDCGYPLL
jgi:hypothetical protein